MSDKEGISQLVDCTEEEFRAFCADKDAGYISGLCNLMTLIYNQVSDLNKDLVAKTSTISRDSPEYEQCKTTLEGLHVKLLRIEQRVFILREMIKEREIKS